MNATNLIEDLRLLSPPDRGWWLAVAAVLVVGFALGLVWLRAWRRPAVVAAEEPSPAATPGEDVLAELDRLVPLLRPETSRAYGRAAATVLRRFIEVRYALPAPRLATEEFLLAARRAAELPSAHQAGLGRFLEACDRFKFGRYTASADELRHLHTAALDFVLASRVT